LGVDPTSEQVHGAGAPCACGPECGCAGSAGRHIQPEPAAAGPRRSATGLILITASVFAFGPAGWLLGEPGRRDNLQALIVLAAGIALALLMVRPPVRVWAASRPGTVMMIVLLTAAVSGRGWIDWAQTGGTHVADDAAMTRYGLAIRDTLPDDVTIAVVWAGSVAYFSGRPAVDLLGKNDPYVARTDPVRPGFYPGHTKWDHEHSVGRLQPDLIAQISPDFSTGDWAARLAAWGYERVGSHHGSDVWAKPGVEGLQRLIDQAPLGP
jgi:hypothetical protein